MQETGKYMNPMVDKINNQTSMGDKETKRFHLQQQEPSIPNQDERTNSEWGSQGI